MSIYRCLFIPQSCIEALTIESGLSLPFTFRYKKATLFAPLRMSRSIFQKRWHCSAGKGAPWGMVVVESPECGKIAVWQLCKERQPLWNSHDLWWPELKMFGSMPLCSFPRQKLLPKLAQRNCHTTVWIQPIADSILVSDQTNLFSFATYGDEYGVPRKALPRKEAKVGTGHHCFSVVPQATAKICPRLIGPRAFFKWKNLIEQLKLLLKWMLIARWRRPSMLSSMRQHVTRLQFDSCARKDSLCGTVMIYDGLNLRCLDQCHCVRSHGKSSSQSWRKRIVIQQSEFSL